MRRRTFLGGALAAVGLVGIGGVTPSAGLGGGAVGRPAPTDGSDRPRRRRRHATKTAKVTTRDLVQTEQVDGRLGYGATRTIAGGPDGIITALPAEGTVDRPGRHALGGRRRPRPGAALR